jgi:ribonuclease HI
VGFMDDDQSVQVLSGTVPGQSTYEQTRAEAMVGAVAAVMEHPDLRGPVALDVVDLHLRMRIRDFLKAVSNMRISIEAGPAEQRATVAAELDLTAAPVPSQAVRPWVIKAPIVATDASIASTGTTAGLGWVMANTKGKILTCGQDVKRVGRPGDIVLGELAAIHFSLKAINRYGAWFKGGLTILSDSREALSLIQKVSDNSENHAALCSGSQLHEAKAIVQKSSGLNVTFGWVKGHQGHHLNVAADRLAVMARRNAEFGVSDDVRKQMLRGFSRDLRKGYAAA